MTVKPFQHNDNNQSPLSVLDILSVYSPETVVKQRPSLSKLPPKSGLLQNASCQRLSTDSRGSVDGIKPVLTACPTSPTRPKPHGRIRVASNLLSRSSSLTDNKVLVATKLQRTPSLTCPDLFMFEDHFVFEGLIGNSPHSEVFRVRHKRTCDCFAIKKSTRKFSSKAHRLRCLHEIMAVASLPAHENIVGQYRAWQQGGHFNIQMELCEGGSLAQSLVELQEANELLSEAEVWYVLCEMAQGLHFLHANGVLHLDVKPDNIYRDGDGMLKLGDFGLAVLRHQWDWEEGDGKYVAPELLNGHVEPTPAADIYSLGATLYECATGETLPRTGPAHDNGHVVLQGRSTVLQKTLQCMLQPDKEARPTAQELIAQVQELDTAVQFSIARPAQHTPSEAMAEQPQTNLQAKLDAAPSYPTSPFTLRSDEDWESSPSSTPPVRYPRPPRITPPPLLCIIKPLESSEPSSSTSHPGLPSSQSPVLRLDGDILSPAGMLSSGTSPLPCSSPHLKRSPWDRHGHPVRRLQQALTQSQGKRPCQLPARAEMAELSQLLPAMPSTTPTLLVPGFSKQDRSMSMHSSDDVGCSGSGIRPFPDLAFHTDASAECALPSSSYDVNMQSPDEHSRSTGDMALRYHWSRQSVAEPLSLYAVHMHSANGLASNLPAEGISELHTRCFADQVSAQACSSPSDCHSPFCQGGMLSRYSGAHQRSLSAHELSMSEVRGGQGSHNLDTESLDRSYSAMSLL